MFVQSDLEMCPNHIDDAELQSELKQVKNQLRGELYACHHQASYHIL